jgi:hypothetical protein
VFSFVAKGHLEKVRQVINEAREGKNTEMAIKNEQRKSNKEYNVEIKILKNRNERTGVYKFCTLFNYFKE